MIGGNFSKALHSINYLLLKKMVTAKFFLKFSATKTNFPLCPTANQGDFQRKQSVKFSKAVT